MFVELISYIKTDDVNVTDLKLSKLVFAHVVDGFRYEKECVIETRTLSVAVREKGLRWGAPQEVASYARGSAVDVTL